MTNEEKLLIKDFLLNNDPILFLGAGFSRFSQKRNGENLPTGKELKERLYDSFIKANLNLTEEDKEEIRGYNLRQLCDIISDSLNMDSKMRDFIIDQLSDAQPQQFHLYLTSYPWKKIYTVNIDDLVERIYRKNKKAIVAQNKEVKKTVPDGSMELIKLHGCVNEKTEKLIFSESDYTSLTSGTLKYRLNDLTIDLQNRSFIIVGASLDEPDLNHYLSVYEGAGYEIGRGRILCISPNPSFSVKSRIRRFNGILIDATTEDFLNCIKDINYDPDEFDKSRMRLSISGIHTYSSIMDSLESGVYESHLYQGYASNWRDLRDNWIILCPEYYALKNKIDSVNYSAGNVYCIAIYGKRFSGKGCLLKVLSSYISNCGYEVLVYNGKALEQDVLFDYIRRSPNENFALLIESAAYYYPEIEQCFTKNTGGKHLLIITTSREYYHHKKKYYLEDNPYEEFQISERITPAFALDIHQKLMDKGAVGWISRNLEEGQKAILKQKTLINLFSSISFGRGFKNRINADVKAISNNRNLFKLYVSLALFDKADLEYYPKELLNRKITLIFKNRNMAQKRRKNDLGARGDNGEYVVDYISYNERGITIKNCVLVDGIWQKASLDNKISCLLEILKSIAPHVNETVSSYWKIIFESLAKEEWIEKELCINNVEEILKLYYQLKSDYSSISYYWLQLGIAEQRNNNYDKAQVHLDMALTIRPNAYQIQHAIARNYLRHANNTDNTFEASEYYHIGKSEIVKLIESSEYYKRKARDYSIHCYISETVKYMTRIGIIPSKEEARTMKRYIDSMDSSDPYYKHLISTFTKFMKDTGAIEYINMKQQDEVLHNLFLDNDADFITDLYQ